MKPRQRVKIPATENVRSIFGSTALIGFSIPFIFSTKQTEANLEASIAKADETIARSDETSMQLQVSMEKSDAVLAEVESNKRRYGS